MKFCFSLLSVFLLSPFVARAQDAAPERTTTPTLHPALFLVGDSITKTGTPPGDAGPWGMGYELVPMFDAAKIHVYNEGAGGRSSRGYIEEGLWGKILARMQPGDFVIVMFGHNDSANSANYPDRTTITGGGEETVQVGVGDQRKTIHTYGWYLRQYVKDAKAKGATIIVCSPVPRNTWADGKIKRGFDGYARWAAEAAKASGALFIDLNTLASERWDALGQQKTAAYFNDNQHTKKNGARVNAECVIAGLKLLKDCPLANYLGPN
jgi:lysophospholipase L1-like esterase